MEADTYVEAVPKLSYLAADVLSRFPSLVIEQYSPTGQYRRPNIALPLSASEALMTAFRRNRIGHNVLLTPKMLGFFSDSIFTPLVNLNLDGSMVDDHTLTGLFASHARNLLYVNLSACSSLTDELNILVSRIAPLHRLRILDLSGLTKVFSPWLERIDIADSESNNEDDEAPWRLMSFLAEKSRSLSEPVDGGGGPNDDDDAYDDEDLMGDEGGSGEPSTINHGILDRWSDDAMEMESGPSHQQDGDGERRSPSGSEPDVVDLSTCASNTFERSPLARFLSRINKRKDKGTSRDGRFILTWSCPNLQALIFHADHSDYAFISANGNVVAEFFLFLLQRTRRLLYLDLSYWSKVGDMRFLRPQRALQTLILYDVPDLYRAVHVICSLTAIRHLDVSQSSRDTGQYPCPVTTLNMFVTSLPRLTSLDITSTNLASNPTKGDFIKQKRVGCVESDIAGLRSLREPLQYLGIFYCDIAAHYQRIPAKKVAGDANETQILLAIEQYMKRPALILKVLNEAYQIYRFGSPRRYCDALQLMLEAMGKHVEDASIQIAASASIFYIIRNVLMTPATKKRVVNALLTGMEEHMSEQTMVRNCCLSLCQFEVPNDLLFDYTRAARLLLRVIDAYQDQMMQRIVIYLLNSMACHVEGEQKIAVGELDAIERILNVISERHAADICDEVMEVAWSFLWNITDETPANCDRFLRNGGMKLFYECYKKFPDRRKLLRNMTGLLKFPDRNELLRNMMGLMGNIAEVKEMRGHLMQAEYVAVFCALLKNLSDGIEISYNSAGVLSNMLSDGRSAWTAVDPSPAEATEAVIKAIETWQVNARRFINYRSFEPILRLVPLYDSPASQHWSIWALANLTTVDGNKYCPYVISEGGVPLLEHVVTDSRPSEKIRTLANRVLTNIQEWRAESRNESNKASRSR